jgi:hypothetical protein
VSPVGLGRGLAEVSVAPDALRTWPYAVQASCRVHDCPLRCGRWAARVTAPIARRVSGERYGTRGDPLAQPTDWAGDLKRAQHRVGLAREDDMVKDSRRREEIADRVSHPGHQDLDRTAASADHWAVTRGRLSGDCAIFPAAPPLHASTHGRLAQAVEDL